MKKLILLLLVIPIYSLSQEPVNYGSNNGNYMEVFENIELVLPVILDFLGD